MAERETNSFGIIRDLRNISIFSTEHIERRTPRDFFLTSSQKAPPPTNGRGSGVVVGLSSRVSAAELASIPQQLRPIFRGRLAEEFFENAVKMRERLKSHLERDLAHPQVRIQKQTLRFLNPQA